MKQLSIKLDPSKADVISIEEYLSGFEAELAIYSGTYKADWLLSDIHASQWIVKTKKTTIKNGKYKYIKTINWHRIMADGSYLDAPENIKVLHFYQKALFILIESQSIMPNANISSLYTIADAIFLIASWSFREELHLNTKQDVLKNITQQRIKDLIHDYVTGSTFKTNNIKERFIDKFNSYTEYTIKSKNIFKLNKKEQAKVISFLEENNCYEVHEKNRLTFINRARFTKLFHLPENISFTKKFSAFLRQFEKEFYKFNTEVLTPIRLNSEYPGHTTPLLRDAINKPQNIRSVEKVINILKELFKLKPLFKNELPDASSFRMSKLAKYARDKGATSELTPWIPLPVCLKILNNAIGFLLEKSDAVLDCVEEVYSTLHNKNLLTATSLNPADAKRRKNILNNIFSKYKDTINIKYFSTPNDVLQSSSNRYDTIRNNMTLMDLISFLQAACYIVIAGLKPIRINEITSLKYNCIYYKENDGYWMMQSIEKSGINGELPEDARPIPKISTKAISVLQRLNMHARKYAPSPKECKYLLYTLKYGTDNYNASICDSTHIRKSLIKFCDIIETPLDKYERRWYVNIHELRKSFLLTFFWTYKFSSLDSCRWIAGHQNPDHVFSYIQANIPGEEMVEVEAEYTYQQIRLFSTNNKLPDIENIEELNHNVCEHFNVKSVTEIDEEELKEWISLSIESGKYEIYVYGINSSTPENSATVAVKII